MDEHNVVECPGEDVCDGSCHTEEVATRLVGRIRCGHCKGRHPYINDVKLCAHRSRK